MDHVIPHPWACASLLLCGLAHPAAAVSVDYVDGTRPAVVIFLSYAPAGDVAMGRDSRSRAAVAMQAVEECLGPGLADVSITFADRIVVRHADDEETFDLGGPTPLPGAVLVQPEANSRIVFAGGGPAALGPLLASAAGDYFGRKCL